MNTLPEAQRKGRENYIPYESAYDKLKRRQAVEQLLLNYREWTTNMINKTQEWTKSQIEQQDGEIMKLQGKYDGIESLINQAVSKSEERSINMTIQLTTKVAKEAEEMINKVNNNLRDIIDQKTSELNNTLMSEVTRLDTRMDEGLKMVKSAMNVIHEVNRTCLLYTSPSPRDGLLSRMPSSA